MASGECVSTRVPFLTSKTVPARMQGVHQGIGHPSEVINHYALRTANAKEHATNRLIQKGSRQYGYVR